MGGRIIGFLGGALLMSAVTFETGEYLKRNQRFVSGQLITTGNLIHRITSKEKIEIPPLDLSDRLVTRTFAETCKDIWNDEVITFVNWIYSL